MPTGNGFPALFYEDDDGPRTTCPGCHNFICPEDDFCMTCGAPLRETTCPSCGYHVRPGAKFCTKCGKDLLEKK
ncbi:double zinc ribbon domain-containing protein [Angelakisella massiliensis]|uniref:double zinc ribbon domain-containing protein n=1 Tax=Angelakisella massiliensis TaxID=1871018 RepID=UPI003C6C9C34